jgi:hypothetical protein
MILCPAVENLGERDSLPTSGRQALLQHEHQHDIAFGGKVRDILSNNRPARASYCRRYLLMPGAAMGTPTECAVSSMRLS